mmetsp:Transcript_14702/g.44092  ORF Transcript_14702/g.44092 Transcript_14702/m.44092 type:complete len:715 (+) Transcript_14702:2748-4892(+)
MRVVHAREAHVRGVAHGVLADEDVVVVELVLDLVGGHHAVVRPVRLELSAAPHVPDEAALVQVQVARELVVRVEAEVGVVVVHVPADDAERRVPRAHPAQRHALALGVHGAREPHAVQVARHAVLDEVVHHADEVDPGALTLPPEIRHVAHRGGRADHDVPQDLVVHLVPVLRVDAHGPDVPESVLLHRGVVDPMERDADLVRVHHGVALEDALRAAPRAVEVHAVAAHAVALAAVLHAGVADVHDAASGHDGVDAPVRGVEVGAVAGDEHVALQVHDLRGELEGPALHLPEAAEVLVLQRLLEVDHHRDLLAHGASVGAHLVEPEAGPGRLGLPRAAPVHGRVVRHEPHLVARLLRGEAHLAPAARVVRDVGGRRRGVAAHAEELVLGGVPQRVEVDLEPRHLGGVLEPEPDPLLAAVAAVRAPAAPARVLDAVDGRARRLVPVRPLDPGDGAGEAQGPLGRAADAADAVDHGLGAARGGDADAVARPPAHPDRVVLQEELVASRPGRAAEQRPGALQRAAVDLNPRCAEAAEEALAQLEVRAAARREVERRPLQHRLLRGADPEVAALLDEDVSRAELQPVRVRVPDQGAPDGQGLDREVGVEQPGLARREDAVPRGAVRVVHQRGVRSQLRENLAQATGQAGVGGAGCAARARARGQTGWLARLALVHGRGLARQRVGGCRDLRGPALLRRGVRRQRRLAVPLDAPALHRS